MTIPKPAVLWTGHNTNDTPHTQAVDRQHDARVVLQWTQEIGDDGNPWLNSHVIYEVIEGYDALGDPIWHEYEFDDIPVQFFLDMYRMRNELYTLRGAVAFYENRASGMREEAQQVKRDDKAWDLS